MGERERERGCWSMRQRYVLGERGSEGGGGGEKALGKEQRRANTWTSGSPRTLFSANAGILACFACRTHF